ncbi:hypothetical protein AB6869_13615 [Rahnella rivi]|uniref:hypothetical protein n=1 Tax=Rahnella rivi TaxID=2816249 RepID=UPI0006F383E5|nr:hypothetical protein ASE99_12945 [Serratia sp. Leaf51]THD53062.1 hypothetical protein ERD95_06315 [Enterobacteriaceae bacterium ML5]
MSDDENSHDGGSQLVAYFPLSGGVITHSCHQTLQDFRSPLNAGFFMAVYLKTLIKIQEAK